MYIPQGYTQEDVMDAASQLPPADEYAQRGHNPTMRVAVRERMRAYAHRPCDCITTASMRVLRFKLCSVLDWRTDTLIHYWTLTGEG